MAANAEQRVDRRYPGVVGGDVRERHPAGDVPDGVDVSRRGAQPCVDSHVPAFVSAHPRPLESEVRGGRDPSRDDEHAVKGDR